jgi:hypothetical protein
MRMLTDCIYVLYWQRPQSYAFLTYILLLILALPLRQNSRHLLYTPETQGLITFMATFASI